MYVYLGQCVNCDGDGLVPSLGMVGAQLDVYTVLEIFFVCMLGP